MQKENDALIKQSFSLSIILRFVKIFKHIFLQYADSPIRIVIDSINNFY